jgi:hypothetical protein
LSSKHDLPRDALKLTQTLYFTHYSTIEICLKATIIKKLDVGYLLGGSLADFGGWILML